MKVIKICFYSALIFLCLALQVNAMDSTFDSIDFEHSLTANTIALVNDQVPTLEELHTSLDQNNNEEIVIAYVSNPLKRSLPVEKTATPIELANNTEPSSKRSKPHDDTPAVTNAVNNAQSHEVSQAVWVFNSSQPSVPHTIENTQSHNTSQSERPIIYTGILRSPRIKHISFAELASRKPELKWCPLCFEHIRYEEDLVRHIIHSACSLNLEKKPCQNCQFKARNSRYNLFKAEYRANCCAINIIKEMIGHDKLYRYMPQGPHELIQVLQRRNTQARKK